jgi:transposase
MAALTINLPLNDFIITETKETDNKLIIFGETTETSVNCHACGKSTSHFHGYDEQRCVEHLPAFGKSVFVYYKPKRYICKECDPEGTTTTATPKWHSVKSGFTEHYEVRLILDLVGSTAKDVAIKNNITEKQVQGIVDRHVAGKVDWITFETLGVLGLDDLSLKKGYKDYISVLTSRVNGEIRIIGLIKGRKKKDVKAFLKSIPKRLKKTVTAICVDMYTGYINAAKEVFNKSVAIIVDRYHVAKLYRASVDKFRQQILKELKQNLPAQEYEKIKHVTHVLRRGNECLSEKDKEKLEVVFSNSHELSEAYRLTLELTHVFNTHQTPEAALDKFTQWILDVRKTKLKCFNKFITTLRKFKEEIANYFIQRQTSGFVEGLNNKIKVLKRRCYGIYNLKHMFQRLHLDVSGYKLYAINKGVL